jgi:hypothetical protein
MRNPIDCTKACIDGLIVQKEQDHAGLRTERDAQRRAVFVPAGFDAIAGNTDTARPGAALFAAAVQAAMRQTSDCQAAVNDVCAREIVEYGSGGIDARAFEF